jgi:YD repeat-containing protein
MDILTTTDQYQYWFDSSTHMMTYMQDKNGNRITLTYSDGKLTQIMDTVGRKYDLNYYSNSLLSSVSDQITGRKIAYSYNADNLLTQVTDPMGNNLTYTYDSSQFLISQADQNGKVFQQLTYLHNLGDSENRVVQTTDATGETWSYSYDPAALSTTITNNDGMKWTYFYDCYMNTIMVQDPEGKRTITEYVYNEPLKYYYDIKAKIDRNGNETNYEVDSATGNTTDDSPSMKKVIIQGMVSFMIKN